MLASAQRAPQSLESVTTALSPTRPASQFRTIARKVLAFGEALIAVALAGLLS